MSERFRRRVARALHAPTVFATCPPDLFAEFRDEVAWASGLADLSPGCREMLDLGEIELDWGASGLPDDWTEMVKAALRWPEGDPQGRGGRFRSRMGGEASASSTDKVQRGVLADIVRYMEMFHNVARGQMTEAHYEPPADPHESGYVTGVEPVLRHGRVFTEFANEDPAKDEYCTPRQCFTNAFQITLRSDGDPTQPHRTYVEGYAMFPGVIPVHHAWTVNDKGQVYDPTWKHHPGAVYVGVPFTNDYLYKTLMSQGTDTVFTDTFPYKKPLDPSVLVDVGTPLQDALGEQAGKDVQFEAAHPRGDQGRFRSKAERAALSVLAKLPDALKQGINVRLLNDQEFQQAHGGDTADIGGFWRLGDRAVSLPEDRLDRMTDQNAEIAVAHEFGHAAWDFAHEFDVTHPEKEEAAALAQRAFLTEHRGLWAASYAAGDPEEAWAHAFAFRVVNGEDFGPKVNDAIDKIVHTTLKPDESFVRSTYSGLTRLLPPGSDVGAAMDRYVGDTIPNWRELLGKAYVEIQHPRGGHGQWTRKLGASFQRVDLHSNTIPIRQELLEAADAWEHAGGYDNAEMLADIAQGIGHGLVDPSDEVHIVRNEDGKVVAAIHYTEHFATLHGWKDSILLSRIGAAPGPDRVPGAATALVRDAQEYASKRGKGLVGRALPRAAGYWRSLGFRIEPDPDPHIGPMIWMDPAEVALAATQKQVGMPGPRIATKPLPIPGDTEPLEQMTKSAVAVKPYVRDGHPVSGYTRRIQGLPGVDASKVHPDDRELATELIDLFHGFQYKDFHTEILSMNGSPNGGEIEVKGGVYRTGPDGAKERIGDFDRRFYGGSVVAHVTLGIKNEHQDAGFAGAFYLHSKEGYRALHFDTVEVHASSIGGYAWARAGFRFADDSVLPNILRRRQIQVVEERVLLPEQPTAQSQWKALQKDVMLKRVNSESEVANWGRDQAWTESYMGEPRQMWMGKWFMLYGGWDGVLDLNEPDTLAINGSREAVVASVHDQWLAQRVRQGGTTFKGADDGDLYYENDADFWREVDRRLKQSKDVHVESYVRDGHPVAGYYRREGYSAGTFFHVAPKHRADQILNMGLLPPANGPEVLTAPHGDPTAVYLHPTRSDAEHWITLMRNSPRHQGVDGDYRVLKVQGIDPNKLAPDPEVFDYILRYARYQASDPTYKPATKQEQHLADALDKVGYYPDAVGGPERVTLRQWLQARPDKDKFFWNVSGPHDQPPAWFDESQPFAGAIRVLREMPAPLRRDLAEHVSENHGRLNSIMYYGAVPAGNVEDATTEWHPHYPDLVNPAFAREVEAKRAEEQKLRGIGMGGPDAYREKAQGWMQALFAQADVSVRVKSDALPAILQAGEYRTRSTNELPLDPRGSLQGSPRPATEQKVWGDHPIYGYLSTPTEKLDGPMSTYGDAKIILNPLVRDRTTITWGDSLNGIHEGDVVPSPIQHPSAYSVPPLASDVFDKTDVNPSTKIRSFLYDGYVEAQILGGVKLEDIQYIRFTKQPADEVVMALYDAGLPWAVGVNTEPVTPLGKRIWDEERRSVTMPLDAKARKVEVKPYVRDGHLVHGYFRLLAEAVTADDWSFDTKGLPKPIVVDSSGGEVTDAVRKNAEEIIGHFHGMQRGNVRISIDKAVTYKDSVNLQGFVYTPELAGGFTGDAEGGFHFMRDLNPFGITVNPRHLKFDNLFLPPHAQSAGFGSAMLRYIEAYGREHGQDRIKITAAHTGAYTWARAGFELDNPYPASMLSNLFYGADEDFRSRWIGENNLDIPASVPDSLIEEFISKLPNEDDFEKVDDALWDQYGEEDVPEQARIDAYAAALPANKFRSMLEIAGFGREHTWVDPNMDHLGTLWLGKAALLGRKWDGVKLLNVAPTGGKALPTMLLDSIYDWWIRRQDATSGAAFPRTDTTPDGPVFYMDDSDFWKAVEHESGQKDVAVHEYVREGHVVHSYRRGGDPAEHFPHLPHLSFNEGVDPPKQKAYIAPPPPRGVRGARKAGGFAGNGQTNTKIGDLGEALVEKLDFTSLLPPGHRQNPLDTLYDNSRWGFEVKTVTTHSTEYKVKMKSHELEGKRQYALERGLRAATMIVVFDPDEGKAHAYWKEGIANGTLNDTWNYAGTVSVADLPAEAQGEAA